MRKGFGVAAWFAVCAGASAQTSFVGIDLQGQRIGWSKFSATEDRTVSGASRRSDSTTVIRTNLIGTELKMRVDSSTWSTKAGTPVRMLVNVASGGLAQRVDAAFGPKTVTIAVTNAGKKSRVSLPRPDGLVVDDPMTLAMEGKIEPGKAQKFWVLDPMTVSFVPNTIRLLPKKTVDGVETTAVRVTDPRAWTDLYLSPKGDLVRAENALGFVMRPIPAALAVLPDEAPKTDLAYATTIRPDVEIRNPREVRSLRLRLTGDLPDLPSDEHQTVMREAQAQVLDIHPTAADPKALIGAVGQAEWTLPSLNLPSDSPRFRALAQKVVGGEKTVAGAAARVRKFVSARMSPNAGIGVLRNAEQVLDSREGVCRDYAVLTTTILRAANVPARLASGLVYGDGQFFYHAWTEVWDGAKWVGVDSTLSEDRLSAVHVKLADGNVDSAFVFPILSGARIEVLAQG